MLKRSYRERHVVAFYGISFSLHPSEITLVGDSELPVLASIKSRKLPKHCVESLAEVFCTIVQVYSLK